MGSRDGRPLRHHKTSTLLNFVENGSIPHILRLAKDGWPTDVRDQSVALATVFRLLDNEPTPANPELSPDTSTFLERTQPLQRVNGLLEVVTTAVRALIDGGKDMIETFSRVFEQFWEVLLRWLNFWLKSSNWILCYDPGRLTNSLFIPARTAEVFSNVLGGCDSQMRTAVISLPDTIRLGLSLWNWVDNEGLPLYFPYCNAQHDLCLITKVLYSLVGDPITEGLIVEEISHYTPKQHRHFLDCAVSRMEQWEAGGRRYPQRVISSDSDIIAILLVLMAFLGIPEFCRVFVKLNVAGKAMQFATDHPEWRVQGPAGTFSIKVATLLFFGMEPYQSPPYFQHRVVPQLIEAGALQAIIDDYFSRNGPNVKYPFFLWTASAETESNPLGALGVACVHRKTLAATLAAFGNLPKEKQLRDLKYDGHHREFVCLIAFYACIWDRLPSEGTGNICDNLTHRSSAKNSAPAKGKKCSGCGVKVYCSASCQMADWPLHRLECHTDRRRRIDYEIAHAWPTHKFRAFMLSLLQQLLLNWEIRLRLTTPAGQLSEDGTLLLHTHRQGEEPRAKSPQGNERNPGDAIHFCIWKTPIRWDTYTVDEVRGLKCHRSCSQAGKIYGGPRFSRLFDEYEEACTREELGGQRDSGSVEVKLRLASLSLTSGTCAIHVLGRFVVERTQETTSVRIANGYCVVHDQDFSLVK